MAIVTRTNGLQATVGTLYAPNCNLWLVTVKDTGASAIDLRAEDDAVNETVEAIIQELNPLAYFTTDSAAGTMMLVMDKAINSASELQARINNW